MRTARAAVRLLDSIMTAAIALMIAFAAVFAIWSAWDNGRIYEEAEDVREDLLSLKPTEENPTLDELIALNPDVRAWVALDGTKVDYPVVQGEDNFEYLRTDVYGEYSLAGSLFLDSRCDGGFGSAYSLVYGHHMANGSMLGSLDDYADAAFFDGHRTGVLVLPDRAYHLEVLAFLPTDAGDEAVFDPARWEEGVSGFLDRIEADAAQADEELLAKARLNPDVRLLALTTCASESDDARTALICVMG